LGNKSYWNLSGSNLFTDKLSYNIGIGTSSPAYLLEIANSATALNVSGLLYANSTNVGIGTLFPSNTLDVRGQGNFSGTVYINNITNMTPPTCGGTDKLTFSGGQFICSVDEGASASVWNASGWNLFPEKLGYNLGIGTSTPSQALDVRGQGNFSGTVYINNVTDISTLSGLTNRTTVNYNTMLNPGYNQSVITIPISANYNYTVYCSLAVGAAATTTGVQLNVSIPIDHKFWTISFSHPTAVATAAWNVTVNRTNALDDSLNSLVSPTYMPVQIDGMIENGATAGNFEVRMRSEINASTATVARGSYCTLNSVS
jgi:hypothetical protein